MKLGLIGLLTTLLVSVGCEADDGAQAGDPSTSQKQAPIKKKATKEDAKGGDDLAVDDQEDAESLIVGIWQVDVASIPPSDEIQKLPKEDQAPALKLYRDSMRNIAYEFAADGKLNIFLGGQSKQSGRYEIKKAKDPDPKRKHIVFIEAQTVGPIGSKTDRWEVKVHTKSLFLKDVSTGRTMRLFRGAPVFKATR
jgi:hypothetical protein